MNIVIDWNALNTLGCWFAGMFTALGVIFSINQIQKNKKIKLEANYMLLLNQQTGQHIGTLITLKIMNAGQRNVTIEEWGFEIGKKLNLTIIDDNISVFKNNLPIEILPDRAATLSAGVNSIKNNLLPYINRGLINENTKLNLYAKDNFSKKYRIKTSFTFANFVDYTKL